MVRVLIVEDSSMLCNLMEELLKKYTDFEYDIAQSYKESQEFLETNKYDFAAVDLHLPDSNKTQIVPLVNRYNIAPIIFTSDVSQDLRETFESANIVDYVLKERFDSIVEVIEKLLQLVANRKKKIMIVDDSLTYRYYLKHNLSMHQFQIFEAPNGLKALEVLEQNPDIELIITDYHMPVMDGLEFTKKVRRKYSKKDVAIIALTAETNSLITSKFLKSGANDYITKPYSRDEFYARLYQNIDSLDIYNQVTELFEVDIINTLCEVTEYKSAETGSHIRRIRDYTSLLAELVGVSKDEARLIGKMAALHDIGKIAIPDSILAKPSKLDDKEFDIIKTHCSHGKHILEEAFKSDKVTGKIAIDIAYLHHERYDGNGYPLGLVKNEIPLNAKIVALVDCFDALATKRIYKDAWSLDKVFEYIEKESGKAFDPKLVKKFIKHKDRFINILYSYNQIANNVA